MHLFKIVLLFSLFTSLSFAQQDSLVVHYDDAPIIEHQISEDHLTVYKTDRAFNYQENVQEDSILLRIKRWLGNQLKKILEFIFGVGKAGGILYFILNILPYIILAILLFFLIKFFLKVNSKTMITGKQTPASVVFTEEEQIIKNEDINALIEDAVNNSNYRLAIRYYYLLTLKHLTESQHILWKQQKTNEDYILEIKEAAVKSQFTAITRIYDYVWYGEFSIDALKFESLKVSFVDLNNLIQKH